MAEPKEKPEWFEIKIDLQEVLCQTRSQITHFGVAKYKGKNVVTIAWGWEKYHTYRAWGVSDLVVEALGDPKRVGIREMITNEFCPLRHEAGTYEDASDRDLDLDLDALRKSRAQAGPGAPWLRRSVSTQSTIAIGSNHSFGVVHRPPMSLLLNPTKAWTQTATPWRRSSKAMPQARVHHPDCWMDFALE